ncbi:hypothetical protein [Macrococcoides caseolyticum]|uniref:hypothetical protein n=1 Tax=Macrococcoides caseolyticum TaxID=69966 RepID=UPI001F29950B|nr:hypothetical protein [Macrococcus caseolyticus]MCE4956425.1 hypothetical protein [Macrococcus caseolyticus]
MSDYIDSLNIMNTKGSVIHNASDDEFIRLLLPHLKLKDMKYFLDLVGADEYKMLLLYNLGLRKVESIRKYRLNETFNITNWKEHDVSFEETPYPVKYIEVNHVKPSEIVKHFKNIKYRRSFPLIINFVAKQTVIRINPFFIDIVSEDKALIAKLREDYQEAFEKLWEAEN